jgi:thiol-disulfide isomerase/thioredoxin
MTIFLDFMARVAACVVLAFTFCQPGVAQGPGTPSKAIKAPTIKTRAAVIKVKKIDIEGLKALIKPNGKPLLINFWATWCDPCREEFPDLVRLDSAYRGKIDFVTVSLDDLVDIRTLVPKFLGEMKAEMPAYLLSTPDESAAITLVSKDWGGNLPLTVLFTAAGDTAYLRKGKIRYDSVSAQIDKILAPTPAN